jgi:CO/xanthine dehydrogenase Mo-binding subunit
MGRKVTFKAGLANGETRDLTVEIHDLDALPWGVDTKLNVVGTGVERLDAPLKATGRATYTNDVRRPNMAYARLLRCFHSHAQVKSIDVAKAERMLGVLGVEVLVPPGKRVAFAGKGVVAVCAETEDVLDDALRAITVEYDVRPGPVTTEDAMAEGAEVVNAGAGTNVHIGKRSRMRRGDPEAALASAKSKVSATFRTQVQTHSALETHGCIVEPGEDGEFTVWASTQGTGGFRRGMARFLRVDENKVRVITEHMGGGFGAKLGGIDAWDQAAATFAKRLGRPVRAMLDRREEHLVGGNRPDSIQKLTMGCDEAGRVTVLIGEVHGTSGNAKGGAAAANTRTYRAPNVDMVQATVSTFAGRGRAFRAPGHPQGYFALEGIVDMLALEHGMDPLAFRQLNDNHPVRKVQWRVGADAIGWEKNRRKRPGSDEGPIKRGVGCAAGRWGQRGRGDWRVDVELTRDGSVTVMNAVQDIGTGTRTLLAMLVAEELGIAPDRVTVRIGDTRFPPGPPSGGSQTAPSIGPAAREAGLRARQALGALVAKDWDVDPDSVRAEQGGFVRGIKKASFAQACALIGPEGIAVSGQRRDNFQGFEGETAGCQFAQVAVDVETGVVRVEKIVAVHDAGRIVNALAARSQVIGGVLQGVSYALFEDRQMDRNIGDMVNPMFDTYRLAGIRDCPEIVPILTELTSGFNNAGMMGLGEPVTVPTAGAIGNAVANAIGARVTAIPITPARVLDALRRDR